ncbi:unnamed protein product [Didymodactylos carnosus]|uniref:Lipoprotein n=1 Tax=Didymodactylos carnosus TaxID=1234261 RepID=A0A8S2D6H8_9BILA|nr:unnamed protein product [Didymodactylos carnosus]CAF3609493.1 unnamed protein product [Didymodactylos carnosus]
MKRLRTAKYALIGLPIGVAITVAACGNYQADQTAIRDVRVIESATLNVYDYVDFRKEALAEKTSSNFVSRFNDYLNLTGTNDELKLPTNISINSNYELPIYNGQSSVEVKFELHANGAELSKNVTLKIERYHQRAAQEFFNITSRELYITEQGIQEFVEAKRALEEAEIANKNELTNNLIDVLINKAQLTETDKPILHRRTYLQLNPNFPLSPTGSSTVNFILRADSVEDPLDVMITFNLVQVNNVRHYFEGIRRTIKSVTSQNFLITQNELTTFADVNNTIPIASEEKKWLADYEKAFNELLKLTGTPRAITFDTITTFGRLLSLKPTIIEPELGEITISFFVHFPEGDPTPENSTDISFLVNAVIDPINDPFSPQSFAKAFYEQAASAPKFLSSQGYAHETRGLLVRQNFLKSFIEELDSESETAALIQTPKLEMVFAARLIEGLLGVPSTFRFPTSTNATIQITLHFGHNFELQKLLKGQIKIEIKEATNLVAKPTTLNFSLFAVEQSIYAQTVALDRLDRSLGNRFIKVTKSFVDAFETVWEERGGVKPSQRLDKSGVDAFISMIDDYLP